MFFVTDKISKITVRCGNAESVTTAMLGRSPNEFEVCHSDKLLQLPTAESWYDGTAAAKLLQQVEPQEKQWYLSFNWAERADKVWPPGTKPTGGHYALHYYGVSLRAQDIKNCRIIGAEELQRRGFKVEPDDLVAVCIYLLDGVER